MGVGCRLCQVPRPLSACFLPWTRQRVPRPHRGTQGQLILKTPLQTLCLSLPSPGPQVFEFGHTNRTTEFTNLNEHSSRSHALLIVTVHGVDGSTGLRTTGE